MCSVELIPGKLKGRDTHQNAFKPQSHNAIFKTNAVIQDAVLLDDCIFVVEIRSHASVWIFDVDIQTVSNFHSVFHNKYWSHSLLCGHFRLAYVHREGHLWSTDLVSSSGQCTSLCTKCSTWRKYVFAGKCHNITLLSLWW